MIHNRYTVQLKLKAAQSDLRAIGITLRKVDGEYHLYPKFRSDLTYFTSDIEDAFNTGRTMAADKTALRF
jgi:hypothetical protein